MVRNFNFKPIGVIRTPYIDKAPYQPIEDDKGDFRIVLDTEYADGLADLNSFKYIYVIYFIDRITRSPRLIECPSWIPGVKVGLFATRSPVRPNPIGLSIVRLEKIIHNEIFTSGLDVL